MADPQLPRVLIIDDDPFVSAALARVIGPTCHVERATSVPQAKDLIDGRVFDLLLCDVVMPKASGVDLLDAISTTRPDLVEKLVFMTGGIFDLELASRVEASGRPLLYKPIGRTEVLDALRLAGSGSG